MMRLYGFLLLLLCPAVVAAADRESILRDYMPTGHISRFTGPVQFWIGGHGALEGQYYIDTVTTELRRIIPQLSMTQVSSPGQANLCFYLTDSMEEWTEAIRKSNDGSPQWQENMQRIRGFTRVLAAADGRVRHADVVLHLAFQTSGGQKLWVVRHELMHALGIMGHPSQIKDTVLNSNQEQYDKNGLFSDPDQLVLKTMYDATTTAGRTW